MTIYNWLTQPDCCGECAALAGPHRTPPDPPHENCQCEIAEFDRDGFHCRIGANDQHIQLDGTILVHQELYVSCCCDLEDGDSENDAFDYLITTDADWPVFAAMVQDRYAELEDACSARGGCPIV
jgi:hypothetical protein